MRTYWFTAAGNTKRNPRYATDAELLRRSLERLGEDLDIVGEEATTRESAQYFKITGTLNAPTWADRIVYIDADAFAVDISGHEELAGTRFGRKKSPIFKSIVDGRDGKQNLDRRARLKAAVIEGGLPEFFNGEYKRAHTEWNAGVIMGPADFMKELVECWAKWWKIIKDINNGGWKYDQGSFRYAYFEVALRKYGYEGLPRQWNWDLKNWGLNPKVNVLHRAGNPRKSLCDAYYKFTSKLLAGSADEPA
ncbi:MAG TPA: hypothetical protein ENH11_08810 [Candidatus Acetothermia bacterium]|nr:hypothetical protein [Candidatus Acetothermia bacterium]